jgi:hypothetical protein
MTECGAVEQLNALSENVIALQSAQASYIAIYLSAVFAFILAAYTAGDKMTRLQVSICNSLFTLFSFVIISRIIALGAGMNELLIDLTAIQGESEMARYNLMAKSVRLIVATSVWSSGTICALVFMWSVRHPKTE